MRLSFKKGIFEDSEMHYHPLLEWTPALPEQAAKLKVNSTPDITRAGFNSPSENQLLISKREREMSLISSIHLKIS